MSPNAPRPHWVFKVSCTNQLLILDVRRKLLLAKEVLKI